MIGDRRISGINPVGMHLGGSGQNGAHGPIGTRGTTKRNKKPTGTTKRNQMRLSVCISFALTSVGSRGTHISAKPGHSPLWAAEAFTPVSSLGPFPSPYTRHAWKCPRREGFVEYVHVSPHGSEL